jgi:hypothetical protein
MDAFHDWISEVEPHSRSALLWHDADLHAAADPRRFAEACAMLTTVFDAWSRNGKQAVLILVGSHETFNRP